MFTKKNMKNKKINKILQSGKDATFLLKDPTVFKPPRSTFLPHICGSLFFKQLDFEKKNKALDLHFISLSNSPRTQEFLQQCKLKYVPQIFEAIDARVADFDYTRYKEVQGIPPVKGAEGHLGCTLSHFYLWKKLKDSEAELHLILEDDTFFMTYANEALDYLVANIPDDADLIYVNGRTAEKLYTGCKYIEGRYRDLPEKMLFSRKEMLRIMDDHYDLLEKTESGDTILYLGADGYILTKSGLNKLNEYVEKFGMEGIAGGGCNNVDLLLAAITTDISDHKNRELVFDVQRRIANGSIADKPILNAYVCSFPIVDTADRAGMGAGSEINKHLVDAKKARKNFLKKLWKKR